MWGRRWRATSRRWSAARPGTPSPSARTRKSTPWARRTRRRRSRRRTNHEGHASLAAHRRCHVLGGMPPRRPRRAGPGSGRRAGEGAGSVPERELRQGASVVPSADVRARPQPARDGRRALPSRRVLLPDRDRVQAAHEFRQVADQYATSAYAPMALLRAGDANLRLWGKPELDPSYGETALAIYQELAGRYPGTDAAARAQMHAQQLKEWFSQKDYKNGMFYFRRRAYDSAIIYFKDVIATYPGTSRVPDALMRLVDSYRVIGYADELKETCAHLRRFFPQTEGLDKSCPADSSTATPS